MSLYHIVILGSPQPGERENFEQTLQELLQAFELEQDKHWTLFPYAKGFTRSERVPAVAVFFGSTAPVSAEDQWLIDDAIVPVVPFVTDRQSAGVQLPKALAKFNAVFRQPDALNNPVAAADAQFGVTANEGMDRLVATALEVLGLLPRQRGVFISYRQQTSRAAAVQLDHMLSARGFEVFLDSHSIGKGIDFQEDLLHRLSDVDVMLMLDSPDFFNSDWTKAEFAHACTRNLGVMCVNWPGVPQPERMDVGWEFNLTDFDLRSRGGHKTWSLRTPALMRICDELERFRSLSLAMRRMSLQATLDSAVRSIGGTVKAVGPQFVTHVLLPTGDELHVTPVLGSPTSQDLEEAAVRDGCQPCAVLYDHVGLRPRWLTHLDWLANEIKPARWIRAAHAAAELRK